MERKGSSKGSRSTLYKADCGRQCTIRW